MILFFGPAGAGKSMQGQMLAARHGWNWISTGKLFRETSDEQILKTIAKGSLISDEQTNSLVDNTFTKNKDTEHIILDGYPRNLSQAHWLVEAQNRHARPINLCVVLEVPREELLKRIEGRGRHDDTPESVEKRLNIYHKEIDPILAYFNGQVIPIARIDGVGSVGQVHDRINARVTAALKQNKPTS